MKYRQLFVLSLLLAVLSPLSNGILHAQSGMDFAELTARLNPYFADELIADVKEAMPQGAQYRIWGWDVGDFSGDGYYDLAVSVNVLGTRRRECIVYLFVDNDGFLTSIGKIPFQYVDLPLEIGVSVKDGQAYVTQKRKADDWAIRSYKFQQGSLVLTDEFVSDRVQSFGHETFRSYTTLDTRERFVDADDEEVFATTYATLPCYSRSRQVFAGYTVEATIESIRNVVEGAFWWRGADDASFDVRVVHDDDNLYFRVVVRDSSIVTGWCDTCPSDRVEIWLDVTPLDELGGSRSIRKMGRSTIDVRTVSDSGLYAFSVKLGDFADKRPSIKVKTTDELDPVQEAAVQRVRVVTTPRAGGYLVKVRIPFQLLGYEKAPVSDREVTELGCTVALYDVDNEFRGEETTMLATSAIRPLDPSTYGALRFVPDGKWYGETANIYTDAVLQVLRELGF